MRRALVPREHRSRPRMGRDLLSEAWLRGLLVGSPLQERAGHGRSRSAAAVKASVKVEQK